MNRGQLAEGLLEEIGQLLQLVMIQHPVSLAVLGDVLRFQHPPVFQLFQNEVKRLVARHGETRRATQADRENRIGR